MQIRRLIDKYIQESNEKINMKDLFNKITLVWGKTGQTKKRFKQVACRKMIAHTLGRSMPLLQSKRERK